jgi:hypothetical protein
LNRKTLDDAVSCRPDRPLYHYTNQTGLLGIIRSKEIWATHTQYLNDSREFSYAVRMVRDELALLNREDGSRVFEEPPEMRSKDLREPGVYQNEKRAALKAMRELVADPARIAMINVCVASFSEVRDSLSQWRAYAPRGGFCMAVSGDRLADMAAAEGFWLAPCVYDRGHQLALVHKLSEAVIGEYILLQVRPDAAQLPSRDNILLEYLNRYAPLLKDPSFAEEREWRIISRPLPCTSPRFCFREGKSMLAPFYRFPLHREGEPVPLEEIIVDPTPDPERSAASVKSFLVSQDYRGVVVTHSAVPYRNW